jgi:serine protease Do
LDEDVNSGFAPDPMEVRVVSGGPIDVSYLGDDCVGYAESNPDVQVHYIAGAQTLLRFYFIADTPGDDAVLIINDTASQWHCNDDYSDQTHDPSIDFSPPVSGYYDIWVGSYTSGEFIPGTLYITELSFNHPE